LDVTINEKTLGKIMVRLAVCGFVMIDLNTTAEYWYQLEWRTCALVRNNKDKTISSPECELIIAVLCMDSGKGSI
jgi:hypothetical protein